MAGMTGKQIDEFRRAFGALKEEMMKVVVGYEHTIEDVLVCFFAGGNALIESVPGLGKTLIVKTLAETLDLPFSRIQFTPDLMPSDIIGTTIVMDTEGGDKVFEFQKGPVFTQILLADEINRATPKTQSALLEAMQERMVSVGGKTHQLDLPYFVLATQNPSDTEGTYALPEAQVDRFLFRLRLGFPDIGDLRKIGDTTTGSKQVKLKKLCDGESALKMQDLVRAVRAPVDAEAFAIRLVLKTHPASHEGSHEAKRFLRYGSSPRGVQGLILGGKVWALVDGKSAVEPRHIARCAEQVLSHRLILNFEGEAEQIRPEALIQEAVDELMAAEA